MIRELLAERIDPVARNFVADRRECHGIIAAVEDLVDALAIRRPKVVAGLQRGANRGHTSLADELDPEVRDTDRACELGQDVPLPRVAGVGVAEHDQRLAVRVRDDEVGELAKVRSPRREASLVAARVRVQIVDIDECTGRDLVTGDAEPLEGQTVGAVVELPEAVVPRDAREAREPRAGEGIESVSQLRRIQAGILGNLKDQIRIPRVLRRDVRMLDRAREIVVETEVLLHDDEVEVVEPRTDERA